MSFNWYGLPLELRLMIIERMHDETIKSFMQCSRDCFRYTIRVPSSIDTIEIIWGDYIQVQCILKISRDILYAIVIHERRDDKVPEALLMTEESSLVLTHFTGETIEDIAVEKITMLLYLHRKNLEKIWIRKKPNQTSTGEVLNEQDTFESSQFANIIRRLDFRGLQNLKEFDYICQETLNFDFFENQILNFDQVKKMSGHVSIPSTNFTIDMIKELKADVLSINAKGLSNHDITEMLINWINQELYESILHFELKLENINEDEPRKFDESLLDKLKRLFMTRYVDVDSNQETSQKLMINNPKYPFMYICFLDEKFLSIGKRRFIRIDNEITVFPMGQ